ncbi:phage portal protein [Larkinella terrae]|uniref:Phage portal protein n=1 Tax=Larkinella terrae TaxID=2025311 RepID=A0A7K0EIX7_9BACT|nr:phage portal protein [Larkinella terrae]MRS61767.1 phage portal protein [Larkinella terrae]
MNFLQKAVAATFGIKASSFNLPAPTDAQAAANRLFASARFQIVNGQVRLINTDTGSLIGESYLRNSDLYSVVRYLVRKGMRANFFLYEVKDKKALSDYRLLKGEDATAASITKAVTMRRKALVDTSQPAIEKLLRNPNPYQDWKTFVENALAYRLLTGERFIQRISGLQPVSELYVLPSALMEVTAGSNYLEIGSYLYTPTQTKLDPAEVIFSKDFRPAITGYGEELRGLSPLKVLALTTQKSNEGRISSIKQYQNGGPPGVLSLEDPDTEPLTQEQMQTYEWKLNSQYGGSLNRNRVHITNMKAEWTALGLSPVDLEISNSLQFDLRDFCRAYGVDSKALSDPSSSTYNNVSEAKKAAVVDAVIPAVSALADDLNACIEPFNVGGKQYFIDADVTHFPELAEDMNKLVERLQKSWEITPNQRLEAQQYERSPDPMMDMVWVPMGLTPISEFGKQDPGADPQNDGSYA